MPDWNGWASIFRHSIKPLVAHVRAFVLPELEKTEAVEYIPLVKAKVNASPLLSRITIDPQICHGKPVVRHLRYPVESILEYLAGGDTFEDLLVEFPDLEREDLQACIEFAAQSLKLKSQHLTLA